MVGAPKKSELIGSTYAGRFRIDGFIDSGVMGSVYRAFQLDKQREVALKVINAELVEEAEIVKRFHREMMVTAAIKHPNTVRVFQYGHTAEGELFLAMELIDGRSLDELILDEAPMPAERAGVLAAQIAGALNAAHAEGVVHRDLKPENIMVIEKPGQPPMVKVLDFGLARVNDPDMAGDEQLTAYGARVGTPTYMAPEYVSTFEIDARSDLYSLGVLFFEMLAGRPPFKGGPYEVMHQHVKEKVPSASSIAGRDVPAWAEELVQRLLQKKPDERPQSGQEVVDAIAKHVKLPVWEDAPKPAKAGPGKPATSNATAAGGGRSLVVMGAVVFVLVVAVTILGGMALLGAGLMVAG